MAENKPSKLTELYAYRSKLTERLNVLSKDKTKLDTEIDQIKLKITGLTKGIDNIENRKLVITSHFIDRYRQRVGPADASEEHIRTHIITPQLLNMINTLGNGVYPVEGANVVVQDNKLITINTPIERDIPIYKVLKQVKVKPRKFRKR